jgi:hypothetical protein
MILPAENCCVLARSFSASFMEAGFSLLQQVQKIVNDYEKLACGERFG